jgi:DNA-binding SARP family transcriptional activator
MIRRMRGVDVRLLGRFEVAVDQRPVPAQAWEHRRAEDLVKLLSLSPGHRLTRDEVVEALWPRLSATAGVANLHKAAHYARRALGWPEAIVLRRGVVELAPGHRVDTDVERLEAGDEAIAGAGELLPDDRYEEWTVAHRDRLAAVRAEALRRQGRWEELLQVDPADEEISRLVMRERAAAGDRRAAARRFRRLRDALAELGLTPSEATLSVYRDIAGGDAVQARTRASGPMVGRDEELVAGRKALAAAARGRGGALLILGDAGMGKTRLVDALLEDTEARGWHTWRGAGREEEGRRPYGPVVDAIAPLVAVRPDLLESLAEPVQRVLALLLSLAPVAGDADRRADVKRHQVFAAVAQLVALAARERGAVMALEDLHAADSSTLLLAHYLSRAARDVPLLVVMTARQGEASPELARVRAGLREQRVGVEVVLRPLARAAVARIAERVAARPLGAGAVDAVVAAAAGNPFFAEELAATVDERGGVRVPEHVNDLLEARLDRIPEDSRSVVRIAGALQDAFSLADLAAVADVDRARAEAAVAAGLRCGVLEQEEGALRFRHPLLRDAARRRFDEPQLVEVHLRAAALVGARGGAPEQVAYHLLSAGRARDAVPLLTAAARRAGAVGAYADGQRWAEQALAHAGEGDRFDLLALIADLRHAAGDRRAAGTYAAAAELAPPELRTDIGIKHAHALTAVGEPAAASTILRDLTAATPSQGGRLAVARGITAWYDGDLAEARLQADRAASLVGGADGDRAGLADLQALIAHAAGTWERHAGWQLAEVWHVPELAGRVFDAYLCVTEYVLHAGDPYTRLAEFARRLRGHAQAAGARRGEAFAATLLGEIELMTGDARAARAHLIDAAALSRKVGAIGGEAVARMRLGEALLDIGERRAALEQIDEALALAQASSLAEHLVLLVHAPLVRAADDPDEALSVIDRAEALLGGEPQCRSCPLDYYVAAATACAAAAEIGRARAFLARIDDVTALWNGGPWAPAAAEARAAVLRAEGDRDGGIQALRRAIAGYAAAGQGRSEARVRRTLTEHSRPRR